MEIKRLYQRTIAREAKSVRPVDQAIVEATLPHLPPVVQAMVKVQMLTGMRSDNLCTLCPRDIDRSRDVWVYVPPKHKNDHRGKALAVALGPKCQAALQPYLNGPADKPCFSPRASRPDRKNGKRTPGARYTTSSYRWAIVRGCESAFDMPAELRRISPKLPAAESERLQRLAAEWRAAHCWHPHQLRHSATDAAKRARGIEGARAYLGHSLVSTTEIYEERDLDLAVQIAREIG
jgi:integrase